MHKKREPVKRHIDPYGDAKTSRGDEPDCGVIEGKNAVIEALRAGRRIDKIYMQKGEKDSALGYIASSARAKGAVVVDADRQKLDKMSVTGAHQGVIAVAALKEYVAVGDILNIARDRGEAPFILICDEITDHHNLGAILRTAEAAGVHGVIIPKRRSAGLGAVVSKTSAGAVEHMAVARVANIPSTINELKAEGIWIYGTSADAATELWDTDFKDGTAIVIGSEGEGMGKLVSERCDFMIRIPMRGKVSSLNASVSAALLAYEAVRQRTANESKGE